MSDDNQRGTAHKSENSQHDSNSSNPTEPLIVTIEPQTKKRDSYEAKSYRIERARYRLEKKAYCVGFLTMVFLLVYTAFTLIVAASSIIATFYAKKSADAAKKSADTGARELELSERPWIKIVDVKPYFGGLIFQKAKPPDGRMQVTISFTISVKNIGRSVADVYNDAELFSPEFTPNGYWDKVRAEEKRFCDSKAIPLSTKFILFPEEPEPFKGQYGAVAPIHPEDINHLPNSTGIAPVLIVCTTYQHKGLPSIYQTQAVFQITPRRGGPFFDPGRCDTPSRGSSTLLTCNGNTPDDLLEFTRFPLADEAY